VVEIYHPFVPGENVQISQGPFQGLEALVTRSIAARDRVVILIEGPLAIVFTGLNLKLPCIVVRSLPIRTREPRDIPEARMASFTDHVFALCPLIRDLVCGTLALSQ